VAQRSEAVRDDVELRDGTTDDLDGTKDDFKPFFHKIRLIFKDKSLSMRAVLPQRSESDGSGRAVFFLVEAHGRAPPRKKRGWSGQRDGRRSREAARRAARPNNHAKTVHC
jgi:hypothetical protein